MRKKEKEHRGYDDSDENKEAELQNEFELKVLFNKIIRSSV